MNQCEQFEKWWNDHNFPDDLKSDCLFIWQAALATRPPLPDEVAKMVDELNSRREGTAADMLEALALDAARRNQVMEQMAEALDGLSNHPAVRGGDGYVITEAIKALAAYKEISK